MKKACIALIFVVAANVGVFCQDVKKKEAEKKFTLQASPFLLVFDLIGLGSSDESYGFFIMDLEGQYKLDDAFNLSFAVSFLTLNQTRTGYHYYPTYYSEDYSYARYQVGFKPMLVYRPFKTGLKGFYIGLYQNIGWQSVKSGWDGDKSWMEIGLGINTGYKWIFNSGFTLQLGTGICKTSTLPATDRTSDRAAGIMNSDGSLTLKNFDMSILEFKLGYSF